MSISGILTYTSWDHFPAGDVGKLRENSSASAVAGYVWSGIIGSIVNGLRNSQRAIRNPNELLLTLAGPKETLIAHVIVRPNSIGTERLVLAFNSGSSEQLGLYYTTTGVLRVKTGVSGGGPWDATGPLLVAGAVYQIEVAVYIHDTLGLLRVRVNGVDDPGLIRTNVDTRGNTTNPDANRIRLHNLDADFDEFYCLQGASGFVAGDLLSDTSGNPLIATLFPTQQGNYLQWTGSAGGDHNLLIDEEQFNGDADYLTESLDLDKESWLWGDLPLYAVSVRDAMTVYGVRDGTGSNQVKIDQFCRIGGTDYFSGGDTGSLSGVAYQLICRRWAVNPATAAAWLVTEINLLESGARIEVSGGNCRLSQAALVVLFNRPTETIDDGNQILPSYDTFAEGLPYGTAPSLYMRLRPSSAVDAVTGYAVDFQWGTLHDGYIHDPSAPTGGGATYSKDATASGQTEALCCGAFRLLSDVADAEITLAPRIKRPFGGQLTTSSTRYVCVMGRIRDGTLVATGDDMADEYWRDISCYMFLHVNAAGLGHKLFLLRLNSGTITVLISANLPPQPGFLGQREPMKMRMRITGAVTPSIQCWFTIKSAAGGQVTYTDVQVFNIIDGSGSAITQVGRWGFGTQSSRLESTKTTYVPVDRFELYDVSAGFVRLRDLFQRWERRTCRGKTDIVPIAEARSLMCDWAGDLHGMQSPQDTLDHYGQLVANASRVEVGQTITIGSGQKYGYYIRQRVARNVNQHRSMEITPASGNTAIQRHMGIVLRATVNYSPGTSIELQGDLHRRKGGYLFKVLYTSGPTWTMEYYHLDPSQTGVSTVPTLLASVDLAAFGLALGTLFTFDCEVLNFSAGGLPGLRAIVNGIIVTPTVNDVLESGIEVVAGWLVDGRSVAQTQGLGEGFFFFQSATAAGELAYFDTWAELPASDPPDIGNDDQASVALKSERYGATGTLTCNLSWPVEEIKGYERERFDHEAGAPKVFMKYRKGRRAWRVQAQGVTTTERQTLQTFVDEHRGTEVPFSWTVPLKIPVETLTVKFQNTRFRSALLAPLVESFAFELEELHDY